MTARFRKHLDLIAFNALILLGASVIAAQARGVNRNSLRLHPEWQSTKPLLAKSLMGAQAFVDSGQAVARNRLNLGAWFGFQEVRYGRQITLSELDVTVGFEPEGYVNILYDIRKDGYSGLRISNRRQLPSILFRASPDGQFLAVRTLSEGAAVTPNARHAVRIMFAPTSVRVFLDGEPAGSFPRRDGPQQIGFRGGQREAWVDDVQLHLAEGTTIRETFTNARNVIPRTEVLFGIVALVLGAGSLLLTHMLHIPARSIGLWMVVLNMGLLSLAGATYAYQYFSPRTYQSVSVGDIKAWARLDDPEAQKLIESVRHQDSAPAANHAFRILFLGSSQTWGAGATTSEVVWVRQLERMLNQDGRTRSVACLNAAYSGLMSWQVLALLRKLVILAPEAAVIDLSNNDIDLRAFRANLDTMVVTLLRAHIPTVLLLEPNSPERRVTDSSHGDLAAKHALVASVGRAHGVPVIDVQGYLAKANRSGFLWWDFVHLTDFGQRLIAEELHSTLPGILHLP